MYIVCTCVGHGFHMVVLPLFLSAAFGWGPPVYAGIISARAASAFLQMLALGRATRLVGGHVTLALLASAAGAAGAYLCSFAAVEFDGTPSNTTAVAAALSGTGGAAQVTSKEVTLLFIAGSALQYAVTGFATGVAAPALSALGASAVQGLG